MVLALFEGLTIVLSVWSSPSPTSASSPAPPSLLWDASTKKFLGTVPLCPVSATSTTLQPSEEKKRKGLGFGV